MIISKRGFQRKHKADHGFDLGGAHGGLEFAQTREIQGHRLFQHQMLPRLRRGDALGDVQVVRGADDHDVNGRIREHFIQLVISAAARRMERFRLGFGARRGCG